MQRAASSSTATTSSVLSTSMSSRTGRSLPASIRSGWSSPTPAAASGNAYAIERLTAALQEVALARVVGAGDRRRVRQRRFVLAAHAPEQIGADRVEQVMAIETIDERQRRRRSFDLGQRNRAVESHDRAWRNRQELVVK
jgi:hypothetical protein